MFFSFFLFFVFRFFFNFQFPSNIDSQTALKKTKMVEITTNDENVSGQRQYGVFSLHPYQREAANCLLQIVRDPPFEYDLPIGNNSSIESRSKLLDHAGYKVKCKPRISILYGCIGSGKTLVAIVFLAEKPPIDVRTETVLASNIFGTYTHLTYKVPCNMVVVPNTIVDQWWQHIKGARVDSSWFVVDRKASLQTFSDNLMSYWNENKAMPYRHVLISVTLFKALLSSNVRIPEDAQTRITISSAHADEENSSI